MKKFMVADYTPGGLKPIETRGPYNLIEAEKEAERLREHFKILGWARNVRIVEKE